MKKEPSRPLPENELISLLKQHHPLAACALYAQYSRSLRIVIGRILRDQALVEEVLQITFCRVWEKAALYDPAKSGLYNWMVRIAQNLSLDVIRAQVSKAKVISHEELDGQLSVSATYHIFIPIDRIGIRALVLRLKQEEQAVIRLQFLEGYTQPEIAKVLDMPLGTVKTRSRNGLIQLRKYFNAA